MILFSNGYSFLAPRPKDGVDTLQLIEFIDANNLRAI